MSQTHAAFQASDMSVVKEEKYVFKSEWFEKQAELIREYLLTFYPKDGSIEMVSPNNQPHSNGFSPYLNIVWFEKQKNVHEKNCLPQCVSLRSLPGIYFNNLHSTAQPGRLRGPLY